MLASEVKDGSRIIIIRANWVCILDPLSFVLLRTGRGQVVCHSGVHFVVTGLFQKIEGFLEIDDAWMPGADSAVCIQI
jgi:hypothetical protein